jgi:hypothetical protein
MVKKEICSVCGKLPIEYMARETKDSYITFLCSKCSQNKPYLNWGITSCHIFKEAKVSQIDFDKVKAEAVKSRVYKKPRLVQKKKKGRK